ncbi:MAG TPA: hypothetical protein VN025_14670 [Candidatus Dormibacteraeota bacterium]|jgi:hypothetical protein|nr:hypothetical protein [Candidatus Dormibacteraeota bacterium]
MDQGEKRTLGSRGKLLTFIFLIGCFSFDLGLYLAGAIRHPQDAFYAYVAVPVHLTLIIAAGLLTRRELDRLISGVLAVPSVK